MPAAHPRAAISALTMSLLAATGARATLYVDDDAPGGGDGASWATAFDSLQDALGASAPGDEIRVAQGIYRPDAGASLTPGDQALSFEINDRTLLGGYAGVGAPDPDARDVDAYETLLSGDLAGDDGPEFQNIGDNTHTIFTMIGQVGATLDGFTITGAAGGGFGASVAGATAFIRSCRFHHNSGTDGGALLVSFSSGGFSTIEQCVFEQNRAMRETSYSTAGIGGAVFVDGYANFQRCRFSHNEAAIGGAVAALFGDVNGVFTNCLFIANRATHPTSWSAGGAVAILDRPGHSFLFQHCLFYANTAPDGICGGVLSPNTPAQLRNCILWHNADNAGETFEAQVAPFPAPIGATYVSLTNLIQNAPPFPADIHAAMNLEPTFFDPAGPDGMLGSDDDDFRPAFGSPAIDAASPVLYGPVDTDYRGLPRPVDDPATPNVVYPAIGEEAIGDIGPYEYQEDCDDDGAMDSVAIAAGDVADCDDNGVPDACQTLHDCNANSEPDECEIASGAALDCNGNGIPDACDIATGASEDANHNGVPDECEPAILYVDATPARGAGVWPSPFTDIQAALAAARARHAPTEIWVAEGTYTPAPPEGPISRAFDMVPGVPVRGGFAGDETSPEQRIPGAHETILSGDLAHDDDPDQPVTFEDNALTVVRAGDCDGLTLDGITIAGGAGRIRPSLVTFVYVAPPDDPGSSDVAAARQPGDSAAALDVVGGSPSFERVTIKRNRAVGAIVNLASAPHATFHACELTENTTNGVDVFLTSHEDTHNLASSTVIGNAELLRPSVPVYMINPQLSPPPIASPASITLDHTEIHANMAEEAYSSIINLYRIDLTLDHALIQGNRIPPGRSPYYTRVISAFIGDNTPSGAPLRTRVNIDHSAIVANDGQAAVLDLHVYDFNNAPLTIRDSTIAGNTGGMYLGGTLAEIVNSVFYANNGASISPGIYLIDLPIALVHHNTIEGFDPAQNNGANTYANISDDPLFRDPLGPDGLARTGDEDFRLAPGSTAADSGDSTALPLGVTTDLAGLPRIANDSLAPNTGIPGPHGRVIDRGAYETQPTPPEADINADGSIDVLDFAILAQNFAMTVPPGTHGDVNGDGIVDIDDFAVLALALNAQQ